MSKTLNDRQRKFAELVVSGVPNGRAYEQAGYSARDASADTRACELMKDPAVAAYIAALRAEAKATAAVTREEMISDLVRIWRSKPSEATMENPLCEIKMSKAGPYAAFPDKSRVAERLAKMLGFDKPDEVTIGVTDELASLIQRVRTRND